MKRFRWETDGSNHYVSLWSFHLLCQGGARDPSALTGHQRQPNRFTRQTSCPGWKVTDGKPASVSQVSSPSWQVGRVALHWATGTGREQVARLLLEHGAAVDDQDVVQDASWRRVCVCMSVCLSSGGGGASEPSRSVSQLSLPRLGR